MFWAEIRKISEFFIWKFSFFLVIKYSIYLNRRVFVMNNRFNIAPASKTRLKANVATDVGAIRHFCLLWLMIGSNIIGKFYPRKRTFFSPFILRCKLSKWNSKLSVWVLFDLWSIRLKKFDKISWNKAFVSTQKHWHTSFFSMKTDYTFVSGW